MATREQRYAGSTRRGERLLRTFGEEVHHARVALGMPQRGLAAFLRSSQTKISRVEAGTLRTLSFIDASRIGAAVGLDLSIKTYPSAQRPRDTAQLKPLTELLSYVSQPLRFRIEVGLPSTGPYSDQRAWGALIDGDGAETAVELESKLYDLQAQLRRIFLKQRDAHLTICSSW